MRTSVKTYLDEKSKPSFWLLHSIGWFCYVIIFAFDGLFFFGEFNTIGVEIFYPLILSGLAAAVLTLPLRYFYRHCWSLSASNLILVTISASFIVTMIWIPIKNLVMWSFYEDFDLWGFISGEYIEPKFKWFMLFMSMSNAFFMILAWSSLYFGINYHYRLIEEKLLHLHANKLSHIAQIKMLRYQINPHFLFNTLNAISTLVVKGNKNKANGMLVKLATFLRYSLDNDPEKKILLYEELRALMLYLEIEKTRFDERLSIEFQVESCTEKMLVPSLLLQPLVENSIKFAIANMILGGTITISAQLKKQKLVLMVADNGPNLDVNRKLKHEENEKGHSGVGIKNIKERLNVLYPKRHTFEIANQQSSGFTVTISIPVEYSWTD
ncbi:MAG: histidine kinase [Paraglaciecola sp.]|uniref:sensor histidine kinase n=1 Tax=Paraglaciecola sp. TaxID=1920173 RepID=UPI003298E335